jgi:hypothetical protein
VKPIIILMFFVQAAILLVTVYVVALRKPTPARPGPVWSSLAISLMVVGMVSNEIAQSHLGRAGADILSFTGAILIGMAVMAALLLFKGRRGAIAAG